MGGGGGKKGLRARRDRIAFFAAAFSRSSLFLPHRNLPQSRRKEKASFSPLFYRPFSFVEKRGKTRPRRYSRQSSMNSGWKVMEAMMAEVKRDTRVEEEKK